MRVIHGTSQTGPENNFFLVIGLHSVWTGNPSHELEVEGWDYIPYQVKSIKEMLRAPLFGGGRSSLHINGRGHTVCVCVYFPVQVHFSQLNNHSINHQKLLMQNDNYNCKYKVHLRMRGMSLVLQVFGQNQSLGKFENF